MTVIRIALLSQPAYNFSCLWNGAFSSMMKNDLSLHNYLCDAPDGHFGVQVDRSLYWKSGTMQPVCLCLTTSSR